MSIPTLETNNATTIDAKGSKILNPIIAPPIPINAAIKHQIYDAKHLLLMPENLSYLQL